MRGLIIVIKKKAPQILLDSRFKLNYPYASQRHVLRRDRFSKPKEWWWIKYEA